MPRRNKKKYATTLPLRGRLIVLFVVFTLGFVVLLARLTILQVLPDPKVATLTKRQETTTLVLTPPRGTIFDRNGRALAVSVKVPSVYADPSIWAGDEKQNQRVREILGLSKQTWRKKMNDPTRRFVWLQRKADPSFEDDLRSLNIRGLGILYEWDRLYPDRARAGQALGFVNLDGKGIEGLEHQYNDSLHSHRIEVQSQKDAKGRLLLYGVDVDLDQRKGYDLHLTLDSTLQYYLEQALIPSSKRENTQAALGIVMNPNNGEILAMSSYPQVNPNRIDISRAQSRKNRTVLDVYEPGSTFKPFVMAEALDQGLLDTKELMNCEEGSLYIGKKKINNPVQKTFLDARGVLKFSNNVCMARIGMRLGKQGMTDMIQKFQFGQKTGIDLPAEAAGLFDAKRAWRDMRLANLSFGQGISVTGVQMVRAMAMLANGGYQVQPHLVTSIVTDQGEVLDQRPVVGQHPMFRPETIALMKSFLHSVTAEDGTGKNARVEGYEIAGKTGTAQIYDPVLGAYSHDMVVSSFIGFAPVENPALVTYIVMIQPEEAEHGGTIAAPVFRQFMTRALPYMGVHPSIDQFEQLP